MIMDMEGFSIGGKFYCKELGVLKAGKKKGLSSFFDIGVSWSDATDKDRKTCVWVQKNVHKLPLGVQTSTKAHPTHQLENIVQRIYCESKTDDSSLVAYKGGHLERDLLQKLGIKSFNLENIGCPKAANLFDSMLWLKTCGNHKVPNAYQHSAKVEVEVFGQCLTKYKEQ